MYSAFTSLPASLALFSAVLAPAFILSPIFSAPFSMSDVIARRPRNIIYSTLGSLTANQILLQETENSLWQGRPLYQYACAKYGVQAINRYLLPVPKDALRKIDRTTSPAHIGKLKNAIDFIVDTGTPVLAAADGIVTFVRDDSYTGGPSIEYWQDSNFIVIQHANGEYSRYDHLAHKSAKVWIGQLVGAGDIIARVGMTGFTYVPHLHFQVFVFTGSNIWVNFETLSVNDFL
ncbi:putative peptidase, M23 precursor [Candidatus Nitrososphaera gargensis Ga9.2]|uniref:Putative peptidase, M23 n=1 Tax=Nitrososphaera gargensis (strain Ga9.2) TaxID=1237085 RepID=K0IH48_NITGG|nr:putative peptidase, M23 precursor [Candidatus Nitrososphaera gargensis Ga9.2]